MNMEEARTIPLNVISDSLMAEFAVDDCGPDPAMSRFLPMAYERIGFDWKNSFEPEFTKLFNGLMIQGDPAVSKVFCAVFPTPDVLRTFQDQSHSGDLLFLHHPIDLQCGDPRGSKGEGFRPIEPEILDKIRTQKLSVFTCHIPMDTHVNIGTNAAIVEALGLEVDEEFLPFGTGNAGRICLVDSENRDQFIGRVRDMFGIPYVDTLGASPDKINKIAIVAGGGDDVDAMKAAEEKGCDLYLTGEIVSNHSWDGFGEENSKEIQTFADDTRMSLVGVSHAASEFLVMRTQMVPYFHREFGLKADVIPQQTWWR